MTTELSPEFASVFLGGGGCSIECSCGRYHFGERGDFDWEENEYENLHDLADKQPAKYVFHPGEHHGVGYYQICGRVYVADCPCEYGPKIETLLRENASEVVRFLKVVLQAEADKAAQDLFDCKNAEEALTQLDLLQDTGHKMQNEAIDRLGGNGQADDDFLQP